MGETTNISSADVAGFRKTASLQSFRSRRALWLALVAAVITILVAVSNQSLWIDEGSSAIKAMQPTISSMWRAMLWERNSNLQLPLYHVVLWTWQKVFGASEWSLRLANGPLLLLAVYGLWLAFRDDLTRFGFAVAFLITNAFVWFYLDEARPYILLLSAASLLFAAVYRMKQNPNDLKPSWAWWFTCSALILCATSMIAAPWAGFAFCAAWYVYGLRFPIDFVRRAPVAFGVLCLGMAGLSVYYLWSLKQGDVPSLGGTGAANIAFAVYDLFGFSGLGPGRIVMRVEFVKAFSGYYLPLAVYAALWIIAGFLVLRQRRRPRPTPRDCVFYLILLAAAFIVFLAGHLHHVRVLPRYLTPAVPLIAGFGSYIGATLWRNGVFSRALVCCLLVYGLFSSAEIRFAERHRKEDYRSAVATAKAYASSGNRIYWAADRWTAIYYGLIPLDQWESGSTTIGLSYGVNASQFARTADVIVISRADVFDVGGAAAGLLQEGGYQRAESFQAFQFWRKTKYPP